MRKALILLAIFARATVIHIKSKKLLRRHKYLATLTLR